MFAKLKDYPAGVGYLLNDITSGQTSIILQANNGANFPTLSAGEYFFATLANTNEVIKCTAISGDVLTVTRGQETAYGAPSAAAAPAKSALLMDVTAGIMVEMQNQITGSTTGWVSSTDTWVYVSASSFKIVGSDVTSTYPVGTPLRWKQGGSYKYGNVASSTFSTDTTITITTNNDYTIANSAITDNYYAYTPTPQGFPLFFNTTPTVSQGASIDISKTVTLSIYSQIGEQTTYIFRLEMTGAGSGGSTVNVTLPLPAATSEGSNFLTPGIGEYFDSGSASYCARIGFDSTTLISFHDTSITTTGAAIGATPSLAVANGDTITGTIVYRSA